jgi:hypothetical protein
VTEKGRGRERESKKELRDKGRRGREGEREEKSEH